VRSFCTPTHCTLTTATLCSTDESTCYPTLKKNFFFYALKQTSHNTFNTYPIWKISRSFELPSPCAHFAPKTTAPTHCHPLSHNQMSLSLFFHHFIFLFFYVPIQTLTTLLIHTRFGRNYAHSNRHLHALILRYFPLHLPTATPHATIK
jgi:hypothetical protein